MSHDSYRLLVPLWRIPMSQYPCVSVFSWTENVLAINSSKIRILAIQKLHIGVLSGLLQNNLYGYCIVISLKQLINPVIWYYYVLEVTCWWKQLKVDAVFIVFSFNSKYLASRLIATANSIIIILRSCSTGSCRSIFNYPFV